MAQIKIYSLEKASDSQSLDSQTSIINLSEKQTENVKGGAVKSFLTTQVKSFVGPGYLL